MREEAIVKAHWALLCENVITNERTNNASLIEVVEQLNVPAPPPGSVDRPDGQSSSLLDMWAVVLWARTDYDAPEKSKARLKMVTPDGEESLSQEYEVDLTHAPRVRAAMRIVGFPVSVVREGEHLLKVEVQTSASDWNEEFELPVWVHIQADIPSG